MLFQSSDQPNLGRDAVSDNMLRILSGKRVLIVDDNDINRKLIQWLIEEQGGEFDSVENGEQAVEACMQVNYDLILMDVSMPVMDGLEASNKIRVFEASRMDQNERRTPIVALTANFLDSDREHFRIAGMDDFVGKPLDKNALIQMIKKWCGTSQVDQSGQGSHNRKLSNCLGSDRELPALDPDMGIRLSSGDSENWRLLLNMLLEQLPKYSLSLTLAAKNREQLINISHKLAGASSCCGASALSFAAKRLEEYCKLNEDFNHSDYKVSLTNTLRKDLQHQIYRLQEAATGYV